MYNNNDDDNNNYNEYLWILEMVTVTLVTFFVVDQSALVAAWTSARIPAATWETTIVHKWLQRRSPRTARVESALLVILWIPKAFVSRRKAALATWTEQSSRSVTTWHIPENVDSGRWLDFAWTVLPCLISDQLNFDLYRILFLTFPDAIFWAKIILNFPENYILHALFGNLMSNECFSSLLHSQRKATIFR